MVIRPGTIYLPFYYNNNLHLVVRGLQFGTVYKYFNSPLDAHVHLYKNDTRLSSEDFLGAVKQAGLISLGDRFSWTVSYSFHRITDDYNIRTSKSVTPLTLTTSDDLWHLSRESELLYPAELSLSVMTAVRHQLQSLQ